MCFHVNSHQDNPEFDRARDRVCSNMIEQCSFARSNTELEVKLPVLLARFFAILCFYWETYLVMHKAFLTSSGLDSL